MSNTRVGVQTVVARGAEWTLGASSLTDDSLVTRAIDGNRDAFGELARRYRPAAVRTAASIVGSDKAEDVVQEALILAFRALAMLHDPHRFPQWLGTITRYRALRHGRKESRRATTLVALDGLQSEPPAPERVDVEDGANDVTRLEAALLQIPEEFSRVLRLHFLEGLPHQRIAERLGVSLSTSKWRCYRGKQLLRLILREVKPAVGRVEQACARCQIRSDGVGCEERFDTAPEVPAFQVAGPVGACGAPRRPDAEHRLPTFRVGPTQES